jgi:uncharacterized protein (DUF427 family)
MKAVWNDVVLAEAEESAVQRVEGNVYFPRDSIKSDFLKPSATQTVCSWKGTASYYTIEADGKTNLDAAWYYPDPKPDAAHIKDHIAFWKGVKIV